MPTRTFYVTHQDDLKAASRLWHQMQGAHVSDGELERLRGNPLLRRILEMFRTGKSLNEITDILNDGEIPPPMRKYSHRGHWSVADVNRALVELHDLLQEALAYGPEKTQVCLWCGRLLGRNLSRHVGACPKMSQTAKKRLEEDPKLLASGLYKDEWGYDRSNPLMADAEKENRSKSRKRARVSEESQKRIREAAARGRQTQAEARKRGEKANRSMRLESRAKRVGQTLPRRPDRQKVSDAEILEVLALDLPLALAAKRVGLGTPSFRWRALRLGWNPEAVKAKRRVINKYIFGLRGWLWTNPQIPTFRDILDWHASGLRSATPSLFLDFTPYLQHFKAELQKEPVLLKKLAEKESISNEGTHGATLHLGSTAITLASRVFSRCRKGRIGVGGAKRLDPKEKASFNVGKAVDEVLPTFERAFGLVRGIAPGYRRNPARVRPLLEKAGLSQQQIESVLLTDRPSAAARHYMAGKRNKSTDAVANDHRFYLRSIAKPTTN